MILVIIDISSITITSACFIISNVVLDSMIVIKYPFIGILNIEWGENMVKYIEKIVISKIVKKGPIFDKSKRK